MCDEQYCEIFWRETHGDGQCGRAGICDTRFELLPPPNAIFAGSRDRRELSFLCEASAVSAGSFDFIYRLRFLSGLAREKMPAKTEYVEHYTFMVFCNCGSGVHPLSPSHCKPDSEFIGRLK